MNFVSVKLFLSSPAPVMRRDVRGSCGTGCDGIQDGHTKKLGKSKDFLLCLVQATCLVMLPFD